MSERHVTPQQNVEVVRRVYARWENDAFGELDDEILDLFDPGIEWDASRRAFDPGVFHGYEGLREFAARLLEVWQTGQIEPVEFIPWADGVVVPVRLRLVSRTHGETMTANAAHLWTLRRGKIVRHIAFQTKAEALEAAGLPE
jgi:ketosteroid isomerase-like protein